MSFDRSWRRFWLFLPALVIGWAIVAFFRAPPTVRLPGVAATSNEAVTPTAELRFSPVGGVFTNRVAVRLASSPSGGTIRYTLDGSEPTTASPKYRDPIEIADTTLVRAAVFDGRTRISYTVYQSYVMADPDLAGFSSNLPLVVLNSFGRQIPHDQAMSVSVSVIDAKEGKEGRATLTKAADFVGRGDLNIRGNTSLRYPKRSYHLKTRDEANRPLKTSVLGFPKESDWVLYAPYPDKTLMRDVLAYELSNQMGRYAARTRFVEVFLNETGGRLTRRNYLGVYVFEEKIKRSKKRVAIEKLEPQDDTEPRISGGYIIKKDHTERADVQEGFVSAISRSFSKKMQRFHSSQGNVFFYVEPDATELTAGQKAWLRRHINNFETVLYSEGFRNPKTGYAAYIDPDSFIDHHWLVELTKNIDGFRFSAFYHKDRGGRINMGPIWDWNLSFGNANGREGWNPEGWYWSQLDDQQYSWFRRLFEDPDFTQKYVDRWGECRNNLFAVGTMHARIEQWAALLNEAQARNFRRWPILGHNVNPNMFVGQTYREEIDWMKKWYRERFAWIDRQFLAPPSIAPGPGPVQRGDKLVLRAPYGKVYYTLDGSDPRASGGGLAPGARLYDNPVPLHQDATLFCRAQQGRRWSYPAVARFVVGSGPAGGPSGE